MCYLLFAIVNIFNGLLHIIAKTIMTVMAMIELLIKTILQILFNILLLLLQVISVLPVCCAFIATSRLRCFFCRRGPDCNLIRGGLSELIMSVLLFLLILLIMKITGVLDTLLNSFGYVKQAKATTAMRSGVDTTSHVPMPFSQVQYVTDYEVEDNVKEFPVLETNSIKNVKSGITDFRSLFKPEQYFPSTDTNNELPNNLWNFSIL